MKQFNVCLAFLIFIALLVLAAGVALGSEDDWLIRIGPERHESPPRTIDATETQSGNEAPVVPQRQSERKKPPEPEYLIGKVIWGESSTFTDAGGSRMSVADWNLVPGDVPRMMGRARSVAGLDYHWTNVNLDTFSYDPARVPVLLFSGVRSLRVNRGQMEALRQYVQGGGMIILDSVYGSPHFTTSAINTFTGIFPGNEFRNIPADHPIFETYYSIDEVDYSDGRRAPEFYGMYIGARIGVFLTPYGVGTGLVGEQEVFELLKARGLDPKYIYPECSNKIAANLVGYAVGYADVGDIQGKPENYGRADIKDPSDEFVFAQIKHGGAWNVHPNAAASLMLQVRRDTAVRVHMRRVSVDLVKDDISAFPFLYLTGLDTFEFSMEERGVLRKFVDNGGFLLVNNGLGLGRFHQSVTAEFQRVFGEELNPLGIEHEVFNVVNSVNYVNYTDAVIRDTNLGNTPFLLGMEVNGRLAVVYSPYDFEAGWLNSNFPLMRGYENRSSQRIGVNLVMYSMVR